MSTHKTFVGKILSDIWNIVGSVFKHSIEGAEKDYNNLPEADKEALQDSAGIFTFIGQELDKTPDILRAAIIETFPNVDEAKLESGLYLIAKDLGLSPIANNLDDTLGKLQEYFKSLQGTSWAAFIQAAAGVFAVFLAPSDSKLSAAFDLIKFVYLKFFKKK